MQEFVSSADVEVTANGSLTDVIFETAREQPDHVSFSRKVDGQWRDVTADEFAGQVRALAKGLVAGGIRGGDRVGLMSRTRYEWTLCDYAIWTAGAVTVPVYETSSAEQVSWYLGDSGAVAAFVETPGHRATVDAVRSDLPAVKAVWQLDGGGLDELTAAGRDVADDELAARRRTVTADSLATIIYTSGTTGRPKGCELTHRNILFDVASVTAGASKLFNVEGSTLLFLPLAHVFARLIQCGCVANRVRMGHTADIKNLTNDFAAFKPTFVLSVPRVFEKVYNTAKQRAHADGKGAIFDRAEAVAIAYSEGLDRGGAGMLTRAQHAVFDKLVYSKLRAALGGQVEYAVSGGAPLGARLGHFFRGVGVTILEGYGLTETTAGATINQPDTMRIGTVGRPLPGTSIRIADDGEVLLRGGNVFRGYRHNDDATREVMSDDGWFHTGDIGKLDDGFLKITGRKKELIVTAAGKNVAPAILEDRLRAHPLVSQCMVVGDQKPFIAALVTIDPEALPQWKAQHGKPESADVADLVHDQDLCGDVEKAVAAANTAVSQAEAIKKFRILGVDFTEEGGQLTPSMKLKRQVVRKEFADEIEALYR